MDQQPRMYKTLACLAAAMTGTSILLGWMDPSKLPSAEPPTPLEISLWTDLAVGRPSSTGNRDGRWQAIEVVGTPAPAWEGAMLAARGAGASYHFFVDRQGRPSRSKLWHEQEDVADNPRTVRISVAPNGGDAAASAAQRLCIEGLLEALGSTLAGGENQLPVQFARLWVGSDEPAAAEYSGQPLPLLTADSQ